MLEDRNGTAAKCSLEVLIKLYKKKVWEDGKTVNVMAAACFSQETKVCCRVLQGVAGCCSVLQGVAVCCSVLLCVAVCCSVSQISKTVNGCCLLCAGNKGVLQCVAVCCRVLQCVAGQEDCRWLLLPFRRRRRYSCGVLQCVAA